MRIVLIRRWVVFKPRVLEFRFLHVNSTISSTELSFLCLDSIESAGRALGGSWAGSLLGVVRRDRLLGKGEVMDALFFLDEELATFFSRLLILLTILSMDFCIFFIAFLCHLLNFWRSQIFL
ncbi:unnamed protein product [Microthlaspi erraticum]|uniref:Uncharacterized protein n=1 Tax=Microthlaspi erraticum TaxID=1685480 RepID=A0A6D2KAA0_9BRAS|nr:unnamed protein product [Microthlaspi erraticum]CAA7049911.1 unnamed protein product [Microthlaspi erraticum]